MAASLAILWDRRRLEEIYPPDSQRQEMHQSGHRTLTPAFSVGVLHSAWEKPLKRKLRAEEQDMREFSYE
jgi:hypothetical protein